MDGILHMKKTAPSAAAKRLAPRRLPTQNRAVQTVESVLRAAGAQIEQDGLDKLTTKRIAAAAGLSVGGLYEYFPNKEAIVSALAAQWMQRVLEAIDSVHPRHGGNRDLITYLLDQMMLVQALYEDQPGLGALFNMLSAVPALHAEMLRHDAAAAASVSSALQHYAPHVEPTELDTLARSISIICHNMLSAALVERLADRDRMLSHLRGCLMSLAARLITDARWTGPSRKPE